MPKNASTSTDRQRTITSLAASLVVIASVVGAVPMAAYASSQYWSGYTIENEIKSPGHPSITGGTGTEYATLLYSNVTTSGYGTVTSGSGATIVHSRTTNLHYCQWRDELDIFVGGTNRLTCSYFG